MSVWGLSACLFCKTKQDLDRKRGGRGGDGVETVNHATEQMESHQGLLVPLWSNHEIILAGFEPPLVDPCRQVEILAPVMILKAFISEFASS